jgi:hypothetical protein
MILIGNCYRVIHGTFSRKPSRFGWSIECKLPLSGIISLRHSFDPANNLLFADTQKASLRLILDDNIKPVVAETAAYRCSPWSQYVYLCVQEGDAYMSCRNSLTHIGSYDGEQGGELWDLGIGNDSLDFCIII